MWIQFICCVVYLISQIPMTSCDTRYTPCDQDRWWSSWTPWSACVKNICLNGTRSRTRHYQYIFADRSCMNEKETETCNLLDHGCAHSCDSNTGYCTCRDGFTLQNDGVTCTPVNLCAGNNGGCDQLCSQSAGNLLCSCYPEYFLESNGRTCAPSKCTPIKMTACPSNSYKDHYGSICGSVTLTCTNQTVVGGSCSLQCPVNYGLVSVNNVAVNFSDNFGLDSFVYQKYVRCKLSSVPQWDMSQAELQSYYCRRRNDPPENLTISNSSILEYAVPFQNIGLVSVSDDENQVISLSIESSQGVHAFRLHDGYLQNTKVFALKNMQYESTIDVMIRATDNGKPPMFTQRLFTIKIIDVNEAPSDIQLSTNAVNDKTPLGSVVGILSAIDVDYSNTLRLSDELEWKVTDIGGHFAVNGSKLIYVKQLYRNNNFLYILQVSCFDSGVPSLSTTEEVIISFTNLNAAPSNVTVSLSPLYENMAVNSIIGSIAALDEDDNEISFVDMSDELFQESFVIEPAKCDSIISVAGKSMKRCSADIILSKELDFEKRKLYTMKVKAVDSGNKSVLKEFKLFINDVNESPYHMEIKAHEITRGAPAGSYVGEIEVFDPDVNSQHSCKVINDAPFYFQGLNLILMKAQFISTVNRVEVEVKCEDNGQPPLSLIQTFYVNISECSAKFHSINGKGCVCKNGLSGPLCDRNEKLCLNLDCPEEMVCSKLLHSPKRCIEKRYQVPILLPTPFFAYETDSYLLATEKYVRAILTGDSSSSRRRRNIKDDLYVETTFAVSVQGKRKSYIYVKLVVFDQLSNYALVSGSLICFQLIDTNMNCLTEADCEILKSAGIPCQDVKTSMKVTGGVREDKKNSSEVWIIPVIIIAVLLTLALFIGMVYLRRRKGQDCGYSGRKVRNCECDIAVIGTDRNANLNVDVRTINNHIQNNNSIENNYVDPQQNGIYSNLKNHSNHLYPSVIGAVDNPAYLSSPPAYASIDDSVNNPTHLSNSHLYASIRSSTPMDNPPEYTSIRDPVNIPTYPSNPYSYIDCSLGNTGESTNIPGNSEKKNTLVVDFPQGSTTPSASKDYSKENNLLCVKILPDNEESKELEPVVHLPPKKVNEGGEKSPEVLIEGGEHVVDLFEKDADLKSLDPNSEEKVIILEKTELSLQSETES